MFCHALIDGIEAPLSMWYAERFQVTLFFNKNKRMGGRYEGHEVEKGLCVTGFVVYIRGILTSMYVDGTFPVKRGKLGSGRS